MTSPGQQEVNIEELSFEALEDHHDLQGFTCGNSSLDHFLKQAALYDQALGLSQTTVVVYRNQVIAFYSAKCTKIEIDLSEASQLGINEFYAPAIEVPFLGVHVDFQNQGIGKETVEFLIAEVTEIAERVGCKFLFLQALNNPHLIQWYITMRFTPTPVEDYNEMLVPMRMPILQRCEFPEY